MIPLCRPYLDEKEVTAVKEVLESGWLAHGPRVKEFEQQFAEYIGTSYAVSFNSCTSALQLAVQCLGITGEVILPGFTFVASANAVVRGGAKPVFVDIQEDTFNIDPAKVEEKITDKTQAIMPVHIAGHPCDMGPLMELAEKHNLNIIEDAAECIGGTYKNKKAGSFGVGCFSFYPTKNITTGEGGMITTNDEALAKKVSMLKAHGIPSTTLDREKTKQWARNAMEAGYNFRMSDVNAAIGIEQMKKLEEMNRKRIENAQYLSSKLDREKIGLPLVREGYSHVYQMYMITVPESVDRENFLKKLREKGIQATIHFCPPVHLQDYYKCMGWKRGDFPVTERLSERIITLPMFPSLRKEDMAFIADTVNALLT
ncbi:MAG: DegT/DnrJ/EryC1/StrS family aminotransferase [Nanoarchaeota archaeon]|nr:DegT/DnrJ/EryC1/StrS family aminotransferase [Nanoarchaeota archaeon]